ncbi:MAG: ADP-ribosylglycohydrolase family protein, partial [Eubacteriales bacterium]|nr:ADP-ribosylglycohydrolase family protein [Eubacteriales bacterium]
MAYPDFNPLRNRLNMLAEYAYLQQEYGCSDKKIESICQKLKETLEKAETEIRALAPDAALAEKEPNGYDAIHALCDGGNPTANIDDLENKMAGAVFGRFAGCTLGVPVEQWDVPSMKNQALYCGMDFPPKEYWRYVDHPWILQYQVDARTKYSRDGIDGVPVDDDVTYTILGLLIVEKYGFDFITEDVGEFWKEYLPYACTAEMVALDNLRNGIDANYAAELNNPYCQWIGADIRADGFAFAAAGNPHLAARLGYYDAYLSHRRNGIYGEMFFAAAEAAAFMVTDPLDAVLMALREIPRECTLHKDIEWALKIGPTLADYEAAREAVNRRFAGMSAVHTNNNACLVVFALILGRGDFSESISQVVAMGLDNDCTGATTGSIMGAIV